jgi:hypothetical protein
LRYPPSGLDLELLLAFQMRLALVLLGIGSLSATTLEKLGLNDMARKSTEIVTARVIGSSTMVRGPILYTRCRIQVVQRWKGAPAGEMDLVVPGGSNGAIRQTFSGAPLLTDGGQYMLFLWTGKSGMTQIIGMSQGLFELRRDAGGEMIVTRNAGSDTMVDAGTGKVVEDMPVTMTLRDMSDRIHRALASAPQ